MGKTLFDKLWDRHVVANGPDDNVLIYIDRAILHEGGGPAIAAISKRGLKARNPRQLLSVADHFVPSRRLSPQYAPNVRESIELLRTESAAHGIEFLGPDHPDQGIVHVIAPETGFTLPGTFIVCTDSHTSTNGALGAVGFGIGITDMAHVVATQCLWQRKPKMMRISIDGQLPDKVESKDVALAVIGLIGAAGGTGYAIEFAGSTVRAMGMAARMTLCNLAIEAGARVGVIAPDATTVSWIEGRQFAPRGEAWDRAVADWKTLVSDPDATFDHEVSLDVGSLAPQVTWGTSPEDVAAVTQQVPVKADIDDPELDKLYDRKLNYMGVATGEDVAGLEIDRVFIGSCTNSRIEDLRIAAAIVKGRQVVVPSLVVPGSQLTRRQAEAEGLDRIFTAAGFTWGLPGCSMCTALNGEGANPQERVASTSNRNFEGRQGRGARTHLMSPAMAAAAAVAGRIVDVRQWEQSAC